MLRALYEYDGVHKGTLPFKSGDKFLTLKDDTGDSNWWQVVDYFGRVGFIPTNFVVKLKGNRSSIVAFTDQVLERLSGSKTCDGVDDFSQQKMMEKVKAARDRAIHRLPVTCTKMADLSPVIAPIGAACIPEGDCRRVNVARKLMVVEIPECLGRELLELIRVNTRLSHQLSKVAVATVLNRIKDSVPSIAPELETIVAMVTDVKDGANLSISHDAKRLREIFFELKGVKEDQQQRSWALYEDENAILEILEELLSILANADVAISKHCIVQENYEAVLCLATYYQMEMRVTIRLLVLKVFGAMCALDCKVISVLLASILPMELAREMQSSTEDIVRLSHTSLVMTMIFSTGECPPLEVYEYITDAFLVFLLDLIDCPPDADVDNQVPDLFMGVLLAFNLHFRCPSENLVIRSLCCRGSAKVFTEKLLLLVNREEDPVAMFDHGPKLPNSALKMLTDVLLNPQTAQMFYTNDIKVLLDIVVRNVTDLPPDDEFQRRTLYLRICQLAIRNTNYGEHKHRRCDIQQLFRLILNDECPPNQADVSIVQSICQDVPDFFCP